MNRLLIPSLFMNCCGHHQTTLSQMLSRSHSQNCILIGETVYALRRIDWCYIILLNRDCQFEHHSTSVPNVFYRFESCFLEQFQHYSMRTYDSYGPEHVFFLHALCITLLMAFYPTVLILHVEIHIFWKGHLGSKTHLCIYAMFHSLTCELTDAIVSMKLWGDEAITTLECGGSA